MLRSHAVNPFRVKYRETVQTIGRSGSTEFSSLNCQKRDGPTGSVCLRWTEDVLVHWTKPEDNSISSRFVFIPQFWFSKQANSTNSLLLAAPEIGPVPVRINTSPLTHTHPHTHIRAAGCGRLAVGCLRASQLIIWAALEQSLILVGGGSIDLTGFNERGPVNGTGAWLWIIIVHWVNFFQQAYCVFFFQKPTNSSRHEVQFVPDHKKNTRKTS